MIEAPPVLTVKRTFPRPAAQQIDALRDVPTGFLADAMGGRGAMHPSVKPLGVHDGMPTTFCGVALTCACGPADNLAVLAALDVVEAGDVIVAATDAFEHTAVIGDLVLGMARNCGAAGFVTDGMTRDLAGIAEVGIPLFCAGLNPNSPSGNGPGSVGLPITLAGIHVASGDVVAGDRDGVVVVPYDEIDTVIARLASIREAEADMEVKVKNGLKIPDHVLEMLESENTKTIE